MAKDITDEDVELLGELGVDTEAEQAGGRPAREHRIIAGFEEIERFFTTHGRLPEHGEQRDIFERIYAVRLDSIRASSECRALLVGMDTHGLLGTPEQAASTRLREGDDDTYDAALLAELGVGQTEAIDVTNLVHVRSRAAIKAAEEIAQRNPCPDFAAFRPLFEKIQGELNAGTRTTEKYADKADIVMGDYFILDGQKILVADKKEPFVSGYGRTDCRLRVVYDNGTESDLLLRSLQRALNKDKLSRRITDFGSDALVLKPDDSGSAVTGHIYVLRSRSDHPFIAQNRSVIHKIGMTTGDIASRISQAPKDATYLLAEVDVVASYRLEHFNLTKLEALIHKTFSNARLGVELRDRFGFTVEPREWFLVPLPVIEDAIQRIINGTIAGCRYDPGTARLIDAEDQAT
jgi:hypothetical protein